MKNYPPGGTWGAGFDAYPGCAHTGCKKKMRTTELGHDCCNHSRHSQEHYLDTQPDPEPYQTIGAQVGELLRELVGRRR